MGRSPGEWTLIGHDGGVNARRDHPVMMVIVVVVVEDVKAQARTASTEKGMLIRMEFVACMKSCDSK